jgi:uncharacterized protein (DUF58 family)
MMFSLLRRLSSKLNADSTEPECNSFSGVRVSVDELIRLRLQANGMRLESRRRVAYATAGFHASQFRGRGIDYQESRNYQSGDDIRHMDWRVTARTGRPHTKLYQEERERPIIVMVDFGPSMFFGTRRAFKSVVATQAAALLGWAAIQHGDRIGAFLFGHGDHYELRPSGGRRSVLRLIRQLAVLAEPDGERTKGRQPSLSEALQRLRRVVRPGSLVFLLSDFYGLGTDANYHLTRLRQHSDIIACQIIDALELAPPPPGYYAVTNGYDMRILDTTSSALCNQYRAHFAAHERQLQELLRKCTIPLLRLLTHEDVAESLRQRLMSPPRGRITNAALKR